MAGLDIMIPDVWRDEDGTPPPSSGPRPEIGSDNWLKAQLKAGKGTEEIDRYQ